MSYSFVHENKKEFINWINDKFSNYEIISKRHLDELFLLDHNNKIVSKSPGRCHLSYQNS